MIGHVGGTRAYKSSPVTLLPLNSFLLKILKINYFFNYFLSFERGSHSAALARKKLIILGWPQIQDSTPASSY